MEFFQLWDEHLSDKIKQDISSQKLEFKLNVYFAVYPHLHRGTLGNQVSFSVMLYIVDMLCTVYYYAIKVTLDTFYNLRHKSNRSYRCEWDWCSPSSLRMGFNSQQKLQFFS